MKQALVLVFIDRAISSSLEDSWPMLNVKMHFAVNEAHAVRGLQRQS